jgi:hypothetical protein
VTGLPLLDWNSGAAEPVARVCIRCGGSLGAPGEGRTRYCSHACMFAARRTDPSLAPTWNGGVRTTSAGYRQVKRPDHPRADVKGYVYEHVLVAEAALGRHLPPQAEVHHFNEIKDDNRGANLVICEDHAYHRLLHARARVVRAGGRPGRDKFCSSCAALKTLTEFSGPDRHCRPCERGAEERRRRARGIGERQGCLHRDAQAAVVARLDAGDALRAIARDFGVDHKVIARIRDRRPSPATSFDLDRGLAERDRGIERVTLANADFVARMREEAVRIAVERGSVHVDDLRRRAGELGVAPASSAAWGAVFAQRGRWRKRGYRRSEVASNHGHESPVWELAEEA